MHRNVLLEQLVPDVLRVIALDLDLASRLALALTCRAFCFTKRSEWKLDNISNWRVLGICASEGHRTLLEHFVALGSRLDNKVLKAALRASSFPTSDFLLPRVFPSLPDLKSKRKYYLMWVKAFGKDLERREFESLLASPSWDERRRDLLLTAIEGGHFDLASALHATATDRPFIVPRPFKDISVYCAMYHSLDKVLDALRGSETEPDAELVEKIISASCWQGNIEILDWATRLFPPVTRQIEITITHANFEAFEFLCQRFPSLAPDNARVACMAATIQRPNVRFFRFLHECGFQFGSCHMETLINADQARRYMGVYMHGAIKKIPHEVDTARRFEVIQFLLPLIPLPESSVIMAQMFTALLWMEEDQMKFFIKILGKNFTGFPTTALGTFLSYRAVVSPSYVDFVIENTANYQLIDDAAVFQICFLENNLEILRHVKAKYSPSFFRTSPQSQQFLPSSLPKILCESLELILQESKHKQPESRLARQVTLISAKRRVRIYNFFEVLKEIREIGFGIDEEAMKVLHRIALENDHKFLRKKVSEVEDWNRRLIGHRAIIAIGALVLGFFIRFYFH